MALPLLFLLLTTPSIQAFRRPLIMHAGSRSTTTTPPPTTTTISDTPRVPKVGAEMPSGRRPSWFHVPAPGGSRTKYDELKVRREERNRNGGGGGGGGGDDDNDDNDNDVGGGGW